MTRKNPLSVATEAALAAGSVLMASYGKLKHSQISQKSRNDFVTTLDKKSEELIIRTLKKYFPGHSIQAEESGLSRGEDARWIIDPLDGTANYIHRVPAFSVSIGFMEKGHMVAGVIYDPLHRELFQAQKGRGAFLNKKRIRVSPVPRLSDALMATGIPFRARGRFDQYLASFEKISLASAGMRRLGSAALDLAYVACGRFEGFWELNLSPWDIAAGALLIEEAGGRISDLWGTDAYLSNGDVLASNGRVHGELMAFTSGLFTPKPETPRP